MANVELTGIEKLLTEIEQLGSKGNRIENKALKEAGEVMKEAIVNRAPRRFGTLQESVKVSGVSTKDGAKHVEVGPGKEGYYGKFLEFGTSKMRAKPFMAPGYENGKDRATATIKEELRRGLGL